MKFIMEQLSQNMINENDSVGKMEQHLVCSLCSQYVPLSEYEQHIALHEQAEMLADILALSRR